MRERDDDAVARAEVAAQLVLGLGEAARRERRALRLEREGLTLRQRVENGRASSGSSKTELLLPHLAHLVGLEDEVGRPWEWRHQIRGDLGWALVVAQRGLGEVEPPLGRRIDDRALDRVQRPLGERREGAYRLDLVAEQLDPERLEPVAGKTSTIPPRTANWPRSSTRSTRS